MDSFGPTPFLDGKVAIVTGAAQGNGFAIAARLAKHGCAIAAVDINAAFGPISLLGNTAGSLRIASFPDIGEADFDATVNLNLKGAFFLTQEVQSALPRGGRIVNIASVAGVDGRTLSAPYAATKAALITITKTLARALAGRGITVNAVAPGLIDTPFNRILDQKIGVEKLGLKPGEMLEKRAAEIPLGRIGKPEEVAAVASFLLGEDAAYVTRQVISVNGGLA